MLKAVYIPCTGSGTFKRARILHIRSLGASEAWSLRWEGCVDVLDGMKARVWGLIIRSLINRTAHVMYLQSRESNNEKKNNDCLR